MSSDCFREKNGQPTVWACSFFTRSCVLFSCNSCKYAERFAAVRLLHQKTADLGLVNTMKKVAVIMGSDSDLPVVEKAFAVLDEYGVPYEAHVMSAHRTPEAVASFVLTQSEVCFETLLTSRLACLTQHTLGLTQE